MTIEQFVKEIKRKEAFVQRLKKYIDDIDRISKITFEYGKTKNIIGNSGYAESDDSYVVVIKEGGDNRDNLDMNISFQKLKAVYLGALKIQLEVEESQLADMVAKKEEVERLLD